MENERLVIQTAAVSDDEAIQDQGLRARALYDYQAGICISNHFLLILTS